MLSQEASNDGKTTNNGVRSPTPREGERQVSIDISEQATSPTEECGDSIATLHIGKQQQSSVDIPSPSNPSTDDLADQLKSTKLVTAAPSVSKMAIVPPSFDLAAPLRVDYHKDLRLARQHEKRRRALGYASQISRTRNLGFQATELLKHGAIDLPKCLPPNLSNDIHPLFHRDRFDDCPDKIYDILIPAFRLASLFLTEAGCCQYLITAGFAERKYDSSLSWRTRVQRYRIVSDIPMTRRRVYNINKYLNQLAVERALTFEFTPLLDDERYRREVCKSSGWAFATHFGSIDYKYGRTHDAKQYQGFRRSVIRLHNDYYITAEKFRRIKHPNLPQLLRFYFGFAVTICHELMHCIEYGQAHKAEPYYKDWTVAEAGATWEQYTFGGRLTPIHSYVDCKYGLAVHDWPQPKAFGPEVNVLYSVPMKYVENLFQKEMWDKFRAETKRTTCADGTQPDLKALHIARNGAQSVHINVISMSVYSDMEELRRDDAEEPVRKRCARTDSTGLPSNRELDHEISAGVATVKRFDKPLLNLRRRLRLAKARAAKLFSSRNLDIDSRRQRMAYERECKNLQQQLKEIEGERGDATLNLSFLREQYEANIGRELPLPPTTEEFKEMMLKKVKGTPS
ncbi:hypothetical protein MMC06_004536 [Schaereria dolodes]|nr:hypothetical protein [Schaereria dolodes]